MRQCVMVHMPPRPSLLAILRYTHTRVRVRIGLVAFPAGYTQVHTH